MAAIGPSLFLAALYMAYIFVRTAFKPSLAPALTADEAAGQLTVWTIIRSFLPPAFLILAVLGSIFGGIATPTEASGVGALGAVVLAAINRSLNWRTLKDVVESSALTTTMLFGLFVGATAFSYMFALLGGHDGILRLLEATGTGAWTVLAVLMVAVFLLGFFFDWIEITLIILPVFAPIIAKLDFGAHLPDAGTNVVWFAMLMAVNLQTSFLTPPFGFALFYMKGAAPAGVKLIDIYKGIVPFVLLQLVGLIVLLLWPDLALWLPRLLSN